MNFKKQLFYTIVILILTGCISSEVRPAKQVTTAQDAVAKQEAKVDNTMVELEKVEKGKRVQASSLSIGIQHSLSQVTNPSVQVDTAKSLNERVISIVGSPHIYVW